MGAGRAFPSGSLLALVLFLAMSGFVASGALAAEACARLPNRQPPAAEALPEHPQDQYWQAALAATEQAWARPEAAGTELLFLGDSLVQSWAEPIFTTFYGGRHALNLGVSGDYTQSLLWRLARMPLGTRLRPKLVVLLIGTNNTARGSRPEDTAIGIAETVRHILSRSPSSRILLVGLLPRGPTAEDPLRAVNERINALITQCADSRTVFFTTAGGMITDAAGRLSAEIAYDHLHLTWVGYGILSAGLEPDIRRLLGQ